MTYLPQLAGREWRQAYYRDFSALVDLDLTGDGEKSVDGITWRVVMASNATAAAVGIAAGGLKITYNPAVTGRIYRGDARTGGYMDVKLKQFLVGTEAETRSDIEIRVSTRTSDTGTLSGTYDARAQGIASRTINASYYNWVHIGRGPTAGNPLDTFSTYGSGSTVGGVDLINNTTSVPTLTWFPNCVRNTWYEGGIRQLEYGAEAAASLAVAEPWTTGSWKLASIVGTTSPIIESAQLPDFETVFYFGLNNYYGTGGLTSMTLHELKVEWRYSSNNEAVFLRVP